MTDLHGPCMGVQMAGSLREIEDAISSLSREELREFRSWYERFDARTWDEQIERDAKDGGLNAIADAARAGHAAGKSRRL